MSEGLSKILSITLYALLGISALLGVLFYTEAIGADSIIYWCYTLFFYRNGSGNRFTLDSSG